MAISFPSTMAFRESFRVITKEKIQWFPGHMNKAFQLMQQKLRQVDCILEVHDARIPFSGRNPNFVKKLIGEKPYVLILNKKDLISKYDRHEVEKKLKRENFQNFVFTNSLNSKCDGLRQIVGLANNLISNSDRFHRSEEIKKRLMVLGVPNVGKSSLINGLRNIHLHKGRATAVGAVAGVTRAVQTEIKISEDPLLYLLDTPGILPPNIKDDETAMRLALCSCLPDANVGPENIADFLLYWLNKNSEFGYVRFFHLGEPCDNIVPVLVKIAVGMKMIRTYKNIVNNNHEKKPDIHCAAEFMIRSFRKGHMGQFMLDRDTLKE